MFVPVRASPRPCRTSELKKERKKTDNPREGWEDGTPPPHRDFKEMGRKKERKQTTQGRDGKRKKRKKENRPAKGGMGGRHAATTQGF